MGLNIDKMFAAVQVFVSQFREITTLKSTFSLINMINVKLAAQLLCPLLFLGSI